VNPTPVSAAHAWIAAANAQDADELVARSSPTIEIVGPRGAVQGTDVLRAWLVRAGLTLTSRRTFARDGRVVLDQHAVWRAPETGEVVGEGVVASRFMVEGEHVVTYERHDTPAAALAAAGLTEADHLPDAEAEIRGWRAFHRGQTSIRYEELVDGAWEGFDIAGDALMGRPYHAIYLPTPDEWAALPAWARDRRDEIVARLRGAFREPDYTYDEG